MDKQSNFHQKEWKNSLLMKDGSSVGQEMIMKTKTLWKMLKNAIIRTMTNQMMTTMTKISARNQ